MKYPEQYRREGDPGGPGIFRIPARKRSLAYGLTIIASDGMGWDHVSVSMADRCPRWEEMDMVKNLFFDPEECVMQLHPPRSTAVNLHTYCLHLWRPQFTEIPRPAVIMV